MGPRHESSPTISILSHPVSSSFTGQHHHCPHCRLTCFLCQTSPEAAVVYLGSAGEGSEHNSPPQPSPPGLCWPVLSVADDGRSTQWAWDLWRGSGSSQAVCCCFGLVTKTLAAYRHGTVLELLIHTFRHLHEWHIFSLGEQVIQFKKSEVVLICFPLLCENTLARATWGWKGLFDLRVQVTTHHQGETRQKPEAWTWEELSIQACFLWLSQLPFFYSKPHLPLDGTPFNRLSPLTSINQQLRKYNGGSSSLEAPFSQVTPGWCQDDSRKLWPKVLRNLTWMVIRIDANWVVWLCEHHAVCRRGAHRSTGRIPRLLLWRLSVPS